MQTRALTALGLALCTSLLARTAGAWCQVVTEGAQSDPTVCPVGGLPVAWPGGCAGISVDPRVLADGITAADLRLEVDNAARRWSDAPCRGGTPSFRLVPYAACGHRAEWNPSGPNSNTVSFRPEWDDDAFHPPEAIAVTITTFNPTSGAIRDADTEINLESPTNPDGFTYTTGTAGSGTVDLPTILTHELGHSQGFSHTGEPDAVMWFETGRSAVRRALHADDIEAVCTVYPPSRAAACDPAPHRGFQCATGCQCRAPGATRSASSGRGIALAAVAWAALAWAARRKR